MTIPWMLIAPFVTAFQPPISSVLMPIFTQRLPTKRSRRALQVRTPLFRFGPLYA